MSSAAIDVRHLRQQYGRRVVLEEVSLQVPCGSTFALLGRNGAGKTTLIRTLLGLLTPSGGAVEVLGIEPSARPLDVRRRVGYLAEDQAMYGWMTADEIAGFLKPFYPTWDDALAARLFQQFDVPRKQRIKLLSKGQNVRLALALALAHRPELVILDDPALGLDPITRKQFNRDVIDHLQAEGRTVFYSSHLLYEVEAVADTVAILDAGRVVRSGSTEALQRDVKRVVMNFADLRALSRPKRLLDVTLHGQRAAVVLDEASTWLESLRLDAIEYTVESLSLDEIFEAFVIGQPLNWPDAGVRESVAAG
jgi:ABC-2 type transport system ATP-binding protein